MRRDRSLPAVAALLSVLALGLAATALESTPAPSPYDVPAADGGSGLSLAGALYALVAAFLEVFGVEFAPPSAGASASVVDPLVAVLIGLRTVAVPLLVVGTVAVGVALAARRLPESETGLPVGSLPGRWRRTGATPESTAAETDWPPAAPESDVSSAWVAMTEAVDVDSPHSRTPAEWADAAVESGFDRDAVAALTRTFREVRYGGETETPERRRRAKREVERVADDDER